MIILAQADPGISGVLLGAAITAAATVLVAVVNGVLSWLQRRSEAATQAADREHALDLQRAQWAREDELAQRAQKEEQHRRDEASHAATRAAVGAALARASVGIKHLAQSGGLAYPVLADSAELTATAITMTTATRLRLSLEELEAELTKREPNGVELTRLVRQVREDLET